ncbi:MAG TPA: peptidoglycan DD-metalloendopeptidase family protein [Candidatus Paceibacterota bacterium]|nr:peptidoglycan DD-metalloendopeptidase family protein [Candidatus Paceibacterota bacterium]
MWSTLLLGLMVATIVFPYASFAASIATDDTLSDRSIHLVSHDDEDRSSGYRTGSSLRRKIADLDDDEVEELPIPVLFGVTLRALYPNFGDPRDGGTREHEGFDILAPEGAPVVSPTEAVVTRIGSGASTGKYVRTANPGGETFVYMHLSGFADIEEGDVLEEGDLIGLVGDTGNASGGPPHLHFEIRDGRRAIDPYPRITEEFSLTEKIEFLERALGDVDDEDEFVELMVSAYQGELWQAKAAGIELPDDIEDELKPLPVVTPIGATAPGDLTLGSQGVAVSTLQGFLIAKDTGPAARALAGAGATGYFGPITQRALIEYQTAHGIAPASGYFGPITRAYIFANER